QTLEQLAQVLAVHELERDPAIALEVAGVVDLGDGPVLELQERAHLVVEAGDEFGIVGEPGEDALDGAEPVQASLEGGAGQVDLAHAARAQRREEGEAAEALRSKRPDGRSRLEIPVHSEAP